MAPAGMEKTPEEFGARGDGRTDDRPAIQAAIEALGATGGVLRFAASTYLIGPEGLKLPSGVELRGAGEASVLRAAESDANERNRRDQDSTENRILNNRILDPEGFVSFAIRLTSDWTENLVADDYTRFNRDNVISGNQITGTRWNAIEIAGPSSRANTISGNTVTAMLGHRGFEADKGAMGNAFTDNTVDGMIPAARGAPFAAFCD